MSFPHLCLFTLRCSVNRVGSIRLIGLDTLLITSWEEKCVYAAQQLRLKYPPEQVSARCFWCHRRCHRRKKYNVVLLSSWASDILWCLTPGGNPLPTQVIGCDFGSSHSSSPRAPPLPPGLPTNSWPSCLWRSDRLQPLWPSAPSLLMSSLSSPVPGCVFNSVWGIRPAISEAFIRVSNVGARVRQDTGSLEGRKPMVMKLSLRISPTLGRRAGSCWKRRWIRFLARGPILLGMW